MRIRGRIEDILEIDRSRYDPATYVDVFFSFDYCLCIVAEAVPPGKYSFKHIYDESIPLYKENRLWSVFLTKECPYTVGQVVEIDVVPTGIQPYTFKPGSHLQQACTDVTSDQSRQDECEGKATDGDASSEP